MGTYSFDIMYDGSAQNDGRQRVATGAEAVQVIMKINRSKG